jgi:hypothetical protein
MVVATLEDRIRGVGRNVVTVSLVDEVHLDGEVLVVDAMLAGGMEVELLEREGCVPHDRRPVHHDLDRCSQVFEGDVMLRCDLHLHKAASFDRN